jgi:hypothetical protein
MPLFSVETEPSAHLLSYAYLIVALHTGRNTTPLLELSLDCLRPHPKDGTLFLVLYKRRGHNTSKVALRSESGRGKVHASLPTVRPTVAALIERVLELSSRLRVDAPSDIANRVWLYALNESQEMTLYLEIQAELDEIKNGVVGTWLALSEPLAGGYGKNIVAWRDREEPITLFKDPKQMIRTIAESTHIRSNGHGWCTAGDNLCVGNGVEPTRCADDCTNAVIGSRHAPLYQRLYDDLRKIEALDDIGDGGRARVRRDMDRCRNVLMTFGHDPERENS